MTALSLAQGGTGRAALLGAGYTLGLGVPFLVVALAFGRLTRALGWFRRHGRAVSAAGGTMLVVVGVLLVTGLWSAAIAHLNGWLGPVSSPV